MMPCEKTNDFDTHAQQLLARTHRDIPLTAAMQLAVKSFDGNTLVMALPLAANINDKGTGFAGSITALGSIAGWFALSLWSEREVGACQVAVFDAQFSFKKPLHTDFTATVVLPAHAEVHALTQCITLNKKFKISLGVSLADKNGEAAFLTAAYAVWRAD